MYDKNDKCANTSVNKQKDAQTPLTNSIYHANINLRYMHYNMCIIWIKL